MAKLSVSQVAKFLGVSIGRVHHRIADGSLPAERVGSAWIVDEADLVPLLGGGRRGRPLSQRSAWAILAQNWPDYHELVEPLTAAEHSKAAQRLTRILASAVDEEPQAKLSELRWALRLRAERRAFRAAPMDVEDARNDDRLTVSGIGHPASNIASATLLEGYVESHQFKAFVDEYLFSAAPNHEANVLIHVVTGKPVSASPLLIAADLADHYRPRQDLRAAEILRELAATLIHRE